MYNQYNNNHNNYKYLSLYFYTGISAICLTNIIRYGQLQQARKRIQNEEKDDEKMW